MIDETVALPPAIRDSAPLGDPSSILVKTLGVANYRATLLQMRRVTDARDASSPDEIWLLEHPPVYTLGQAGRIEHLLDPNTSIDVEHVERGGQITYHGPGQVVAYTLIDLRRRGIKVREFVELLEAALIDTLAAYNVKGQRRKGAPGIYVDLTGVLAKIAALGLKVKNGCTFHGVALNVAMDLTPFTKIDPCGYAGLRTVDLSTLGVSSSIDDVADTLGRALADRIERKDAS
jgi:lipoyl(octanoyl) transferase